MPVNGLDTFLDEAVSQLSGIPIAGAVIAGFTVGGTMQSLQYTAQPTGAVDVGPEITALAAFLQRHRGVRTALRVLAPRGAVLVARAGHLVLRAEVSSSRWEEAYRPLGARCLPPDDDGPDPEVVEVLGALAARMEPGTHTLLWSHTASSMHAQMMFRSRAPEIETLVAHLQSQRMAVFQLRLFRFSDGALLVDDYKDIAWFPVAPA